MRLLKRFTDEEIQQLADTVAYFTGRGNTELDAFEALAMDGTRTAKSYQLKWYAIKRKEKGIVKTPKHPVLDSVKEILIENEQLSKRVMELEKTIAILMPMKEEYESLLEIMNRARKMAFLSEEQPGPKFKMDSNGNLERIDTKEE